MHSGTCPARGSGGLQGTVQEGSVAMMSSPATAGSPAVIHMPIVIAASRVAHIPAMLQWLPAHGDDRMPSEGLHSFSVKVTSFIHVLHSQRPPRLHQTSAFNKICHVCLRNLADQNYVEAPKCILARRPSSALARSFLPLPPPAATLRQPSAVSEARTSSTFHLK